MFDVFPLSPVREWAISRSFMASRLHETDDRLRKLPRQQHGGNRDDIARRFPGAATTGRTVGVERLDLVADPDRLAQAFGAAGDANAHLIGLVGLRRYFMRRHLRPVQGIDTDQVEAQ